MAIGGGLRKALRPPYADIAVAAIGAIAGYLFFYDPGERRIVTILVPALVAWCLLIGLRNVILVLFDLIRGLLD